jgi:hypothetical protein
MKLEVVYRVKLDSPLKTMKSRCLDNTLNKIIRILTLHLILSFSTFKKEDNLINTLVNGWTIINLRSKSGRI